MGGKPAKAARGKPKKGPAKTTVKTIPLPEITPKKDDLVVVLGKTGAVPDAYPILQFELKGPPNWLFDVQVARLVSDKFTEGPGLTGSWDKTKAPKDRLSQRTFSSWTNGDTTLKFDGSGKGKYTMPTDWWKDLARLPRKDFRDDDFYYRVLAFKDAKSSVVYSTKNGVAPPSMKIHNNLTDFALTDNGYVSGGTRKSETVQFTVREEHTTEMYTVVQWMTGSNRIWGGGPGTYAGHTLYGITHDLNCPERTIDSLTTNPRPSFFGGATGPSVSADGKTATGTDSPGGPIAASDTHDFFTLDFETRMHLNFEVPASVKITRKDGTPPRYGVVTGALGDPQPSALDALRWNARILQVRKPDGSVDVSHPDTYAGP